jgi:sugar/nucleoside kinase (ribokinase family)
LQLTRAHTARAALKVLSKEVPCAVVKRGARGALAVKDGKITSAAGFKVESKDTTGAGDSFAAGFISSYLRGRTIAECLRAGNACGALSTLRAGGTAGQPSPQALKNFLGANRPPEHFSEPRRKP